jgi:hypothetical protein
VTPDVEKIAEMKLNNIIPSVGGLLGGGKTGGASGILATLMGGGQQPQQAQQAQQTPQAHQAGKPAAKPAPAPSQQQQLQNALGGLFPPKKKPTPPK